MKRTAIGKHGVVSSAHPLATMAGLQILKKGGNAVDAAIAAALVLGVAAPAWSGIGGGGFGLIHLARSDRTVGIDYREVAPKSASDSMFRTDEQGEVEGKANAIGPLAIAVPGTPGGIATMVERYATMKLRDIYKYARDQAATGTQMSPAMNLIIRENRDDAQEKFARFKRTGDVFLRKGSPMRVGEKFLIPNLAKTLDTLIRDGPQSFYHGPLAGQLVSYLEKDGAILAQEDLAEYSPRTREPVTAQYRGYEICGMPPPSSGGLTLIEILNIIEGFDFSKIKHYSPQAIHVISEAMRLGFADRILHVADPDFVTVPVSELVSKKHAEELRSKIESAPASGPVFSSTREGSNTTHVSVMDKEGNVAALTESIECCFGSGILVPDLGVLMNDEMHDFNPAPGTLNSVQPKKRPLSSMAPTILFRDGHPRIVLGSAGGSRIISSVAQIIINMAEFGMTLPEAVASPRFHVQRNKIILEKRIHSTAVDALRGLGHQIEIRPGLDLFFGGVNAVAFDPHTRAYVGAADPRRDGIALAF